MIFREVLNAASMAAPLLCLWRHKGAGPSLFRRVVCVQVPVSALYHLACAFPRTVSRRICTALRLLDFSVIHGLSLASRIDFRQPAIHTCLSAAAHAALVYLGVFRRDPAVMRFALIMCDNWHLAPMAPPAVGIGAAAFLLYFFDDRLGGHGHAAFHVSLYWLFDAYLAMLRPYKGVAQCPH